MTWFSRRQDKSGDTEGTASSIISTTMSMVFIIINGTIGVMHMFALRDLIMAIVQLSVTFWAWRFAEIAAGILLSIGWLVLILVLQNLYEKDFKRSWIPKRFLIFTAIQLVFFGVTVWLLGY